MDSKYEKIFVDKFIQKNRRSRILYELSNVSKRHNVLGRFSHNSLDYIERSKIIYAGNTITNDELDALIKRYTSEKEWYLISWNCDIDGCILERKMALNEIIGMGMASILVFTKLLVIKAEQEREATMKYVLVSD